MQKYVRVCVSVCVSVQNCMQIERKVNKYISISRRPITAQNKLAANNNKLTVAPLPKWVCT